jgi:TetR/AcrR family transcriptional repressor of bet genes
MTPPTADQRRQQILEAARRCLARNGYQSTTISEVAAETGVSRGLLHYHFKNKEELLAQVARQTVERSASMIRELFRTCGPDDDLAVVLTGAFRRLVANEPDFYVVFFECWAVARQSEMVATEMTSLYAEFRDALREGLDSAVERSAIAPRLGTPELALLLTSLLDGLGLQLTTESDLVADEGLWRATEAGIRCALGEAT